MYQRERLHFFLVFLDPQTELPACLSNIRAGAVPARDTIDQFGLLFILDLVLQIDKSGTLDQEDTDVHESECRILRTQPHMGPGDFQVTCSIEL